MRVFGINAFAGIYFSLYGLFTHFLKRGVRSDRRVF